MKLCLRSRPILSIVDHYQVDELISSEDGWVAGESSLAIAMVLVDGVWCHSTAHETIIDVDGNPLMGSPSEDGVCDESIAQDEEEVPTSVSNVEMTTASATAVSTSVLLPLILIATGVRLKRK